MKLAIVGTGIAGMTAAHVLHRDHDLTIFEAGAYIGGHTNTVDVNLQGTTYAIDTGFIVFNDWTYPNFMALLDRLGVASQPSDMSFSVRCEETGLEYNGTSLNSLFAQRRNLLRPSFYRMIRDILRFNRESLELLDQPGRALRWARIWSRIATRRRLFVTTSFPWQGPSGRPAAPRCGSFRCGTSFSFSRTTACCRSMRVRPGGW